MQEGSSVFSLIFFLSALVSLFWGGHVIRLKPQRNINRAFLALSMALSIWSFGFAMANSQQSLDVALVWRRFSAIGWTSVFSLIVHFLLLLTSQKKDRKRDRSLFLLHIPAVIMMIVFAFSNQMAKLQYNLVKFDYGWINIAVNNGWDYAYYFYYVLYMIWGLVIIWKWKRIVSEKTKTSQGNLIFASIMAAAVFGSFTDLVSSSFLANPLPQMAPLFMFFPIGAMYCSIRYYDLINHNKLPDKGLIVSEADKQKIFYSIAIIFVVSGIFSFIFEYNLLVNTFEANFSLGFFKSVMFVVTGISIYLIQAIKNTKIRELMTIIVLVIHIPIITFQFLDYSGITVWAFPIIIIITSLVFRKKTLLISTGIVTIITQRLIWILKPEEAVVVDKYDYMLRIIILAGAVLVAYYVNKIYIAKIEENDYQIAFQKMDSDISFDFIGLNQDNFNDNVNHFLMRVATFFEGDRSYLFTINHQKGTMTYSNEWCASGIDPETRFLEEVAIDAYPWWIGQAQKNKPICIENTANMPSQARLEQEQFLRRQVKSVVLIPVLGGDEVQGFIGVDSIKAPKKWLSEDIKRLKIMGNLLASGMTQIKLDQEIEFMAYYDQLTGLPNRFLFADRVKQAIKLSQRTGKFIAVIFIDLDNFKSVNDTIGHKGGDILLKEVAQGLSNVLRKTDTIARFGGDEFMIMLNHVSDGQMISKIADKILALFARPFTINSQEFLVTASAGIAIYSVDGEDAETLIKNADIAMYKAKEKGKNQYALCTREMKDEVQISMELSNDLCRALERDELIVYYQPQIDLMTKKITGIEALLRWVHPTRGMISPGIFIPIAEKNSLINSIGEWVLKTACEQNKKWQDMGLPHMNMAVNLSAIQIINPQIAESIERIIRESGLDPKYIELEITESIAIKETDYVLEILNKLKKIGVAIAIDDFGTEYSSLSRLKDLPIDRIKIDMQFVQGIESNEKDKAITMVIINLAKSLGLSVLAEGVETELQLEFLNQKMCDNVQGYYYYKPMPAKEIEEILKDLQKMKA